MSDAGSAAKPAPAAGTTATREWALAIGAGLCAALAFPLVLPAFGYDPALDALPREGFILVPAAWLYHLTRSSMRTGRRMLYAWVAGSAHFALLIYWLDIAMVRFGYMPQWQAVPAIALLVAYCAGYWALVPPASELLRLRGTVPPVVAFALAVVLLEWLRGVMLTGFPWGLWGYSQARNLPLIQLARFGGVYAVTWVIALAGALLSEVVAARKGSHAVAKTMRLGAFVIAAHAVGGVSMLTQSADEGDGLTVAVLQGSIDQAVINRASNNRTAIIKRYDELTTDAVNRGAELVVWPEAAWPGRVSSRTRRLGRLRSEVPLLVGVSLFDRGTPPTARNSAVWIGSDGRIAERYDKQHLVPFGEYVPLRSILPVDKFVTGLLDYSAGISAAPLGDPPVGVLICYDGIFPDIARAEVNAGATMLANLTNDAWYGISSAPYQHRDFYVLRAVETDRWVFRAANTGLSMFIDPLGRLHAQTRLTEVTASLQRIFPRHGRSPYVRLGDWLPAVAIGLALAALLERLGRAWRLTSARSTPHKVTSHVTPKPFERDDDP